MKEKVKEQRRTLMENKWMDEEKQTNKMNKGGEMLCEESKKDVQKK